MPFFNYKPRRFGFEGQEYDDLPLDPIMYELERVERLIDHIDAIEKAEMLRNSLDDVAIDAADAGFDNAEVVDTQKTIIESWLGWVRAILRPLDNN